MDNKIPQIYDRSGDYSIYDEDMNNVYSTRFNRNNRYDNRYDDRYDNRFDSRYDDRYDNYYDRDFNRNMRYYQYPYCDRNGRCENPIWWLFWPFFFL